MKELTELQRKAQEYWPSYVDEFVNEKFPKRMRNYYIVLIILSLAFAFIITAIDHAYGQKTPFIVTRLLIPLLIFGCILHAIQSWKCNFPHFIEDNSGMLTRPMFPRTRMKQELRKKLTKFDRVFRILCIILGIVAFFLCFILYCAFEIIETLPEPPTVSQDSHPIVSLLLTGFNILTWVHNNISPFYAIICPICYALIMAAVVAIFYFPPRASLYQEHCSACDMCQSEESTKSKDESLGLYSSGSAERTVADIYLGSQNVGSIKETYSTGTEEKRRATHTHRCAFCGETYTHQFTYWKKV